MARLGAPLLFQSDQRQSVLWLLISTATATQTSRSLWPILSPFQAPVTILISGLTAADAVGQIAVADFNGDLHPDLAVGTTNGIAVFLNDATGGFSQAGAVAAGQQINNLAVADLDNDGILDLVAVAAGANALGNPTGAVFYALGKGDGTFQATAAVTQFTGSPAGLAVGDLNHDGLKDIVVANSGGIAGTVVGGGGGICPIHICPNIDPGGGG